MQLDIPEGVFWYALRQFERAEVAMKTYHLALLVLTSLVICGSARAQTGSDLLPKCKALLNSAGADAFNAGYCGGFLDAAYSMVQLWQVTDESASRPRTIRYCAPENVTNGQIARVFVKDLEDHPEELHRPASLLYAWALEKAFPCTE